MKTLLLTEREFEVLGNWVNTNPVGVPELMSLHVALAKAWRAGQWSEATNLERYHKREEEYATAMAVRVLSGEKPPKKRKRQL